MSEPAREKARSLPSTTRNAKIERCASCGAAFGPEDRFCSTCGANREPAKKEQKAGRRGAWLILSVSVALLAVLGVVALIYFSAPERRSDTPVGHLTLRGRAVLAIDPGPPVTSFVGTGDGLFVSGDRGGSWQSVSPSSEVGAIGMAADPRLGIYLAGTSLWRFDIHKGLTPIQTTLPTADVVALAVDPTDARRFYAVVQGRGLLASGDAGGTWQQVANLPTGANSLALAPTASARYFVGTAAHGVFASSDGRSWVNASGFVNGALPTANVSAVAFDPGSGDQYVSPSGQATSGALYAATDHGVYKSIDSGISWSSMPFHRDTVALAVATDGSHLMLALDADGNVYRSKDGGNSWSP
jgi:photosystem II stability/assembly factor-like uncharacterized protein